MIKWPFLPKDAGLDIVKTEGAYLYTRQGQKILDAASGAIVNNIGYGREEVAEAIKEAALNNTYVLPPFLTPEREELLDELRNHWLPPHLTRVHLSSGGSEANESAVKLAIQYQASRGKPEKNLILTRTLSYHGTTLNMSGISGHAARKRGLESYVPAPITVETPYPLRCPLGSFHPEAKDYYLNNLKEVIERYGANHIAALLMEPINGSSGGAIYPPEGYWEEAQKILLDNDILLIADEVMTGFGRTGAMFAGQKEKVTPDFLCVAKGLTGGYLPMAATLTTQDVFDAFLGEYGEFKTFFHGHSFTGNQLGAAAALANLDVLQSAASKKKRRALEKLLRGELALLWSLPNVGDVRQEGLVAGVELVADWHTREEFPLKEQVGIRVCEAMVRRGVLTRPIGNVVPLLPPYCTTQAQLCKMVRVLRESIVEVLG